MIYQKIILKKLMKIIITHLSFFLFIKLIFYWTLKIQILLNILTWKCPEITSEPDAPIFKYKLFKNKTLKYF